MKKNYDEQDMDYIESILTPIRRIADASDFDHLNKFQKVALMAYYAKGVIDNGGFQYLFELGRDGNVLADAYASIGVPAAAETARAAMRRLLSNGFFDFPMTTLLIFNRSIPTINYADLDNAIYDLDSEIITSLANYVRSHEQQIRVAQ